MGSTSTRKAPHCFNFIRQMQVLGRAGAQGEAAEVFGWQSNCVTKSVRVPYHVILKATVAIASLRRQTQP